MLVHLLLGMCLFTTLNAQSEVRWVGARSSIYGSGKDFPSTEGWLSAAKQLAEPFPEAKPTLVWIVGALSRKGCRLEFPRPARLKRVPKRITFMDEDRHEATLTAFDRAGVSVFLQVEPGLADVDRLLELVMKQYKHHPCIAGFGIDVEWHKDWRSDRGKPVKDRDARRWETRVKAHHPEYRLFLKHYNKAWLGHRYRGDIVFVDDSQKFSDASAFQKEMQAFADHFYPNPVMFQIGYPADRSWWRALDNPPRVLGEQLAQVVRQPMGLIWVDFTLRDVVNLGSER